MKKILLLCLGAALILTASIGGTLAFSAYSTAYSDGTMRIEINQQIRTTASDGKTTVFGDMPSWVANSGEALVDSAMYPSYSTAESLTDALVGGQKLTWYEGDEETDSDDVNIQFIDDTKIVGAVDNIVSIENKELEDAYVRVYLAFEAGDAGVKYLHINKNETDWSWTRIGNVEITNAAVQGMNISGTYDIYEAIYIKDGGAVKGVLSNHSSTTPCLYQVAINGAEADEAFLTEVGDTYEILIFAQAVQTKIVDEKSAAAAFNAYDGTVNKDSAYFSKVTWGIDADNNKS